MFTDTTWLDVLLRAALLTPFAFAVIVVCIRVVGLRSLSKMTPFDFVVTVALGSVLATTCTASEWSGFATGLLVMAALLGAQFVVARLRKDGDAVREVVQNQPRMLMRDGVFFDDVMQETRVTRGDVIAKLREANVLRLEEVRAVVLEATGDIAVLHGATEVEDVLLEGVRREDQPA